VSFIRRPSELSIPPVLERIRTQAIGGNGGGGIVEIPNLHGGQIDFNHVSVGTKFPYNLITYPNHIIYSNLDTCHKTHDDIPKINIKADTAPKVVKISVWLISKAGNNHGDPNNQSTIMITCMKLSMGLSLYRTSVLNNPLTR
jgi:hypothetical protein